MLRPLLYITLLALLCSPLAAREFTARQADWDDLSQALDITPVYITLKDKAKAKTNRIVIDIYRDGQLLQQLKCNSMGHEEAAAIDLKFALFLKPPQEETVHGVTVLHTAQSGIAKGILEFPASFAAKNSGVGTSKLLLDSTPITVPGKTPLYGLVYSASGAIAMTSDWEKLSKANPGAHVFIFSLETE